MVAGSPMVSEEIALQMIDLMEYKREVLNWKLALLKGQVELKNKPGYEEGILEELKES